MTKTQTLANTIIDNAAELGWTISTRENIVSIAKTISPGCKDSFAQADGEYFGILSMIPMTRAGSMWGTDGGGMGAVAAMKNGRFIMNMSGGSKRLLKALRVAELAKVA